MVTIQTRERGRFGKKMTLTLGERKPVPASVEVNGVPLHVWQEQQAKAIKEKGRAFFAGLVKDGEAIMVRFYQAIRDGNHTAALWLLSENKKAVAAYFCSQMTRVEGHFVDISKGQEKLDGMIKGLEEQLNAQGKKVE
jgi:hypothetical protein